MPLNRIVALLTPAFTAVAAIGSGWLARHTGVTFSPDELLAIEIGAATSAGGAALKWLHGHQKLEADVRSIEEEILHGYIKVEQFDPALVAKLRAEADKALVAAQAEIQKLIAHNATAVAAKEQAETARVEAETKLTHIQEKVRHVFSDPNLILPDIPAQGTQTQPVPTGSPEVEPGVLAPAEQSQEPAGSLPDVVAITPQTQIT